MHLTPSLLFLGFLLTLTLAGPVVRVHNTKTHPICLTVETSAGYGSFPTNTNCGGLAAIGIDAMQTAAFYPSDNWNGAISDFTNAGTPGTRFEINFSVPGQTWYNADMEFGITSGTLGPTDNRRMSNGKPSFVGEADPLAKANSVWASEKSKLQDPLSRKYVTPSQDGNSLVNVYMDKDAPENVVAFFQLAANFNAYIHHGSVRGDSWAVGSMTGRLKQVADTHSGKVDGTNDMTITIY
ncbi:MAG: hypothetical protein L6R36_004765 [Xanthoria steineri]|nr:MAG: hypothetical protein L6R36_004765 [Xanthoria steineri]